MRHRGTYRQVHLQDMFRLVSATPLSDGWFFKRTTFVRGSGMIRVAICSVGCSGKSRRNCSNVILRFSILWSAAGKPPARSCPPLSPPSSSCVLLFWRVGIQIASNVFQLCRASSGFSAEVTSPRAAIFLVSNPSCCSFDMSPSIFLKCSSFWSIC